MNLLELFCDVDDFWKAFAPWWQTRGYTGFEKQIKDGWRHGDRAKWQISHKGVFCDQRD